MRKNQKGEFLSSRVRYIAIGAVRPNPQQPRRSFDETALRELADSIRAYGILQPLTVRDKGGYYELVAGERRLRAARMAVAVCSKPSVMSVRLPLCLPVLFLLSRTVFSRSGLPVWFFG